MAVVTALREEVFWVSFLKIAAANFAAGDLSCDREHWNATAMAIIKTVDQMQIAWAATPRAYRQSSRQMCFRAGREGGCLFVAHVNLLNLALPSNRVGNSVEGIAGNPVEPFHAGRRKSLHKQIGHCFCCHCIPSLFILQSGSFTCIAIVGVLALGKASCLSPLVETTRQLRGALARCISRLQEIEQRGGHLFGLLFVWQMA